MKKIVSLTESDLTRLVRKVIKEQQQGQSIPQSIPTSTTPAPTNFSESHNATVQVDCKSKLVKISNYTGKLNAQGNALIMDAFCNPKNRP